MTYGSDFNGVDDLDFGLKFLEGESSEQLALSQAVARRFLTPRGGLFYNRAYGLDLRLFLADSTPVEIAQGLIAAEARKDERIVRASCTIDVGDNGAWVIDIHCFGDDGNSFSLTFQVTLDNVTQAK